MTDRRLKGLVLLVALFAGGVVAPTSHFIYMAACKAPIHGVTHGHAHDYSGGASAVEMRLSDAHPAPVPCAYAALFATQMAGETPPSQEISVPTFAQIHFVVVETSTPSIANATLSIRGPPSAPAVS